jgi:hypothetical protein
LSEHPAPVWLAIIGARNSKGEIDYAHRLRAVLRGEPKKCLRDVFAAINFVL